MRKSVFLLVINIALCIFLNQLVYGLEGNVTIHDPSLIRVGNTTYAFSTGHPTMTIRKTTDSTMYSNWTYVGYVWETIPSWIVDHFDATPFDVWAPDINYWNRKFYLYYSVAIIGDSHPPLIGLMTSKNIEGPWLDEGMVISRVDGIDPNITWVDSVPYLTLGSWEGIYLHEIDPATGKLSTTNTTLSLLAKGIEASAIVQNNGYFFLFGSTGLCCSGVNSTYFTVLGRSTNIRGPYLDINGVDMTQKGRNTILSGLRNEIGTGGGDFLQISDDLYFCYHFYDPFNGGAGTLNIRKMTFKSDWPVMLSPIRTYPAIYDVSSQQMENPATNILDDYGNDGSRWSAQGYPQSLMIDYGKEIDISGFELWAYQSRAYQFKTKFSNDPEFTTFTTEVDMLDNISTEMPLSATVVTKSRYVKITVDSASNYTGDWISLSGFRLLGTGLIAEDLWYTKKEDKIAEAAGLHIGDSIDITSIIYNPGFEKNQPDKMQIIPGWTLTGTANSEFCTRNNDGPDNFKTDNVYFQHWSSATPKPDFSISQKFTNLPNGLYTLTVNAGGSAGTKGTYVYANNTLTEVTSTGEEYSVTIVITNGELTIGFKSVNRTAAWAYADNFSLIYKAIATDLNSLNKLFIKKKAIAESILADQNNPGWYNSGELTSAINTLVEQTEESLCNAISALETAIGNYHNIIKRYKLLKDKIAESYVNIQTNYPSAAAYQKAIDKAQAVYDNTTEQTLDNIASAITELDAAYVAYYISQPYEDKPIDFTLVIANPSFEDKQGDFQTIIPGWTRTGVVSGDNFNTRNNNNSIKSGNVYFEHWSANKNDFTLSQKITGLPNGNYKLTAAAGGGTHVYIFANNSQTEITAGAKDYTADGLVTNGTLTIGFKSIGRSVSWVYADNFRLKYNNPISNIEGERLVKDILKVFPVDGGIKVLSSKPQTLAIYTITGQTIKESETVIGEKYISLPKGFYIVNNIKVIVL